MKQAETEMGTQTSLQLLCLLLKRTLSTQLRYRCHKRKLYGLSLASDLWEQAVSLGSDTIYIDLI